MVFMFAGWQSEAAGQIKVPERSRGVNRLTALSTNNSVGATASSISFRPMAALTDRFVPLLVLMSLAMGLTGCESANAVILRNRVERQLTSRHQTEHVDVFTRPDSRAAAEVKHIGELVERELARICQT
ncbi:MAG: hypothetical protein ABIR80_04295, partial [Opitutaceae bacterium]